MLSAAHTLISLPFGIIFHNPILILCLAAAVHFVSDTFLHWNIYPQNFKKYPFLLVGLDVGGGIVLAYLLLGQEVFTLPILAAIAGGNAPDVLHAVWNFAKKDTRKRAPAWMRRYFAFHEKIQWETQDAPLGLLSQLIAGGLAILTILTWR